MLNALFMYICSYVYLLNLSHFHISSNPSAVLDYLSKAPFGITFPAGSKRQLYNVTIVDDIFPEDSEYFNADVNATPEDASRVLIGSPKQPLIEIQDKVDRESLTVLTHSFTNLPSYMHLNVYSGFWASYLQDTLNFLHTVAIESSLHMVIC